VPLPVESFLSPGGRLRGRGVSRRDRSERSWAYRHIAEHMQNGMIFSFSVDRWLDTSW
jgi:hypothetical protein